MCGASDLPSRGAHQVRWVLLCPSPWGTRLYSLGKAFRWVAAASRSRFLSASLLCFLARILSTERGREKKKEGKGPLLQRLFPLDPGSLASSAGEQTSPPRHPVSRSSTYHTREAKSRSATSTKKAKTPSDTSTATFSRWSLWPAEDRRDIPEPLHPAAQTSPAPSQRRAKEMGPDPDHATKGGWRLCTQNAKRGGAPFVLREPSGGPFHKDPDPCRDLNA